jgi:hypothetical protein
MVDSQTKLQQISDVAWIVQQGNQRIGLLNKDVQNHYTFISGKTVEIFDNDTEVTAHFGNIKLFEEKVNAPTTIADSYYIKGFLVEYPDPVPVEPGNPHYRHDLPLYSKTSDSDVLYAAGWYCIKFDKGWKHAHGPKLSTLKQYGYKGPFRTQLECKHRIKLLNKQ